MIYYKRYTGKLLPQKTAEQPSWVQWTHHSEGKTHCEECLMLDGCWFQEENAPSCPHHPYCHCTLDPIPYEEDEVFPADLFYSFYYYSWQAVLAYRGALEQEVSPEFLPKIAAVLEGL